MTASPGPEGTAPGPAPGGLWEPLLAFLVATAAACALFWTARAVPFIDRNLHGAIAIIFLYVPALAGRLSGRPVDYRAVGLHAQRLGLALKVAVLGALVAWPVFFAAFWVFYGYVCKSTLPIVQTWIELFAPVCHRWTGLAGATFRLPDNFALLAASQLLVVAIPEEFFFRGYLYARLEERWPSTRQLLGAPVGRALLVSSALFAAGHFLVDFNVQRLAVFFPALGFGWMRARTGSIAAGAIFHAACNLYSETLYATFFR